MATYKRNSKSVPTTAEFPSNSASPASSVAASAGSAHGINNNVPKYGTLVPNRIFVGGISSNTTEAELTQLFSKYGCVRATKIIADRAGVSKGYGFVTFESEDDVRGLIQESNSIVLKERKLNIAPAVKKQPTFSRPFDTTSPPPTAQNVYFHNGVPYTFHNGMAFFPSSAHPPSMGTMPPSAEPPVYSSYGPSQSAGPSPSYGTSVIVPQPHHVFMSQAYPYQPLPMANGGAPQFVYTGPGASNGGSGSTMTSPPDMTASMPTQYYTHPYGPHDYYHPTIFLYPYPGEYEVQDQHVVDGRSSPASTPHSDVSERSSNKSPPDATAQNIRSTQFNNKTMENNMGPRIELSNKEQSVNKPVQTVSDCQVPVVSWQNLKNQAEERELHISNGRRSFYPTARSAPLATPPQGAPPPVMFYQPPVHPVHKNTFVPTNNFGQRQNIRFRPRPPTTVNVPPYIPKFPNSFNNNNPHTLNNNYHDTKMVDVNNGKPQKYSNNRLRGGPSVINHTSSPPPSKINPSYSNPSEPFPSPQIVQQPHGQYYERQYGQATNPANRWPANTQAKRLPYNKRQSGSNQNMVMPNDTNNVRLVKKPPQSVEGDLGGGGDAQPIMQLALTPPGSPPNSKMQALSLETSC